MTRPAQTRTGGRDATTRSIPPKLALAVGMPSTPAPPGWRWAALTDLARLESGHTPSRRHPEYWGGDIPWISIADAKTHHGGWIDDTGEHTNALGIANSSARMLPAGTVCLSRTASVGYVVVMRRPMATSQDFVNWVCGKELDPEFLKYLFIAEGGDILRFASGAVHQTIYFPEAKAFHVCVPQLTEQRRIVGILGEAFEGIATARDAAEKNLHAAGGLFESFLQVSLDGFPDRPVEKSLAEVASFRNGINYTKSSRGERVQVVGVKDFQDNFWVPSTGLDTVTVDGSLGELDRLRTGDILTVRSNGSLSLVGRCMVAGAVPEGTTNSGFTIRIRLTSNGLLPEYLCHFLRSGRVREQLISDGTGTSIKSLSQTSLASLVIPIPSLSDQREILDRLEAFGQRAECVEVLYQCKIAALDELKRSLLHQAFTGQLTASKPVSIAVPNVPAMSTIDMHAGIIAIAHRLHERRPPTAKKRVLGHVKAEKIAHMVESHLGVDLGRAPIKDAAGPNDFSRLKRVEHRARKAGYFAFERRGAGYRITPGAGMDRLIERTRAGLGDRWTDVVRLVRRMVGMTTRQAEIIATVYAAWNNLLLDGEPVSDERIVFEARENWHPDKLAIPREQFFSALAWMRTEALVPSGTGKRVAVRSA